MAGLGQEEMDIDSGPIVSVPTSKSPRPWDIAKLRETITTTFNQMLEPIRLVVREEISSAFSHEQGRLKPSSPDPAIAIRELQEQLEQSKAEKNSLSDEIDRLNEEAAQARLAVGERDARNKKLQQVIIENSQNITPPMDDEIIRLFIKLNHDIMRIVKKHFTKPFRIGTSDNSAVWREYKNLSPENMELWVRAYIANDLYDEFFHKKRRIFGLDGKREDTMKEFESLLAESSNVSEADIVDWRIRTVSCGQKLGLGHSNRRSGELAVELVHCLRPVSSHSGVEYSEAKETMAAIYNTALKIAILFRSNTVSYSWLQRKSASSIPKAEREVIGSTDPSRPEEQCKPWMIVFGGIVKNQNSEEDKVVLTKSELMVSPLTSPYHPPRT